MIIVNEIQPIPKDTLALAIKHGNDMADTLKDYLLSVSEEQLKKVAKVSNKTLSFITKSGEYSESSPQFLPNYLTSEQLLTFVNNFNGLRPVLQMLKQLVGDLEDTSTVNGSLAYSGSLDYYRNVKEGSKKNIKDAKEIKKDLSARFSRRKKKGPDGETDKSDPSAKD